MGSSRLPGKVLKPLDGVPMLGRIVDRLSHCRSAGRLIVATTDLPRDDAVAAAAGTEVFRGSETDVLDRYYRCARLHGLSVVVRATADNPFVDPEEGDRVVAALLDRGVDYVTMQGLPVGVALEAMTMDALERAWRDGREPHHREHVNDYILENPALFPQIRLDAPPQKHAPDVRLTVDTPEDFAHAEALVAAFRAAGGDGWPGTGWLIARALTDRGAA